MIGKHTQWTAITVLTVLLQLTLGTSLVFAGLSLTIFLLMPFSYRLYREADSIGAILLLCTFGKLFIIAQWIKIGFLQPGDTNLARPNETAFILLLGLVAFFGAGFLMRLILPMIRVRLLKVETDRSFLLMLGLSVFVIAAAASVVRHLIGIDRLSIFDADDPELRGHGLVIWNYLAALLPLSSAVFTARNMLHSSGRRFLDTYVLLSLVGSVLLGVWDNSRTVMFSGVVTAYLTYLSYGGRVRSLHIAVTLVGALVMSNFIFPFIDLQRGLPRTLSPTEFMTESINLAVDVVTVGRDTQESGASLSDMYESWTTRLYYGDPTGFLDRFSPSQVDEVVDYVMENGFFGFEHILHPFARFIPYAVLSQFGADHPISGGRLLESQIWGSHSSVFFNYGVIAETYAYADLPWYPVVFAVYLSIAFVMMHMAYGGLRRNYFAPLYLGQYLFQIADSDMADVFGRLFEQTLVYVVLYGVFRFLWSLMAEGASATRTPDDPGPSVTENH